ncbi:MAG TPA: HAD family phosphatase [Solirubrobacterales bacterium]|nr:HAD family phosphatase [Solirubrobacterales bacterium]
MPGARTDRALLVDYGGVLTSDIWSSFADFCERRGLDRDAAKQLFRDHPEAVGELRRLETGDADPLDFERRFAKLLGTEPEGLIEGLFAGLGPAEPMIDAVRRARDGGIPTALVSNSWVMDHYTDEVRSLFDVLVISGEVGLHKPQPEIYLMAAERVGAAPAACVFVDDLRENCEGAERVGMTAVLHRDPSATIAALEGFLGLALR